MITLRLSRWPRRSRRVPGGRPIYRARGAEVMIWSRLGSRSVRHLVKQGLGWSDSRVDFYRHSNRLNRKFRLGAISQVYHVIGCRPTCIFWAEPHDKPALTSNSYRRDMLQVVNDGETIFGKGRCFHKFESTSNILPPSPLTVLVRALSMWA